jgi:hypothetical protein
MLFVNRDTSTLSPGRGNKVPQELKDARKIRVTGASGKTMELEVTGATDYQCYVALRGKHEEAQALPFKGELTIEVVEKKA